MKSVPYTADRLHRHHPPLSPRSRIACGEFAPSRVGSKLDADHPRQRVKIARRFTPMVSSDCS
jgi:hypothetical protein